MPQTSAFVRKIPYDVIHELSNLLLEADRNALYSLSLTCKHLYATIFANRKVYQSLTLRPTKRGEEYYAIMQTLVLKDTLARRVTRLVIKSDGLNEARLKVARAGRNRVEMVSLKECGIKVEVESVSMVRGQERLRSASAVEMFILHPRQAFHRDGYWPNFPLSMRTSRPCLEK